LVLLQKKYIFVYFFGLFYGDISILQATSNKFQQMYIYLLLQQHFINSTYKSDMFQPSRGRLQVVTLIHFSSEVNKMNHQM